MRNARIQTVILLTSAAAISAVQASAAPGEPEGPSLDAILDAANEQAEQFDSIYLETPDELYQLEEDKNPLGGAATIFVNFDGETLNCVNNYQDDSRTNTSWVCGSYVGAGPYNYSAFNGSQAQRQAALDATKEDWAPFNVSVTDNRPQTGDYTMAMVGPSNFIGGGVLGVAPLDCNDGWKNNVVYAFNGAQHSANVTATTISQEVAHAYGLEHVNNPSDVMNPSVAGGNQTFVDQCTTIVAGGQCASQHAQNCGGGQQNGYADLIKLFGPASPDSEDPTVNITAPSDGQVFQVGDAFTITVSASDDSGVTVVELYVDGEFSSGDQSPPYEWPVGGIPAGEHEFYAIAKDEAGNESISAVVTVHATEDGDDPDVDPMPGDGDGDGDDDDGTEGGPDGPGPYPGPGLPPGYGQSMDEAEVGCGCATNTAPAGAWSMLLAGLGLLSRRRRSITG